MSGRSSSMAGIGIAIGVGVGAAFGVAIDNLALGIGCGIAIGAGVGGALQAAQNKRNQEPDEGGEQSKDG